jgi:hypothetical protein
MVKSKSKPEHKSERSTQHLNLRERMTLPANIQQNPKLELQWLSPKTIPLLETTTTPSIPLLETTTTHSNHGSILSKFADEANLQRQRRINENILKRKTRREQDRIKPLLVKYLQYYLKDKRYKIYPYVMGNVFGNLPDGYYPNMLYLCGYKTYNNEMEYIEIPIDIDALDSDGDDGIQEIRYNVPPKLINKVNKLITSSNTTNKLDFSRANGGKNNKKKQSKSMRSRASTKSHKHHRKSFTLKNVK